jgi:uncharacterized protein (TIGR00251 family)
MGPTTRLRLRVSPGASRSGVVGRHGEVWKVRVTAPPENGKANDAVLDLLATTLEIPRARIEIVSGHGSRDKTVAVDGLPVEEIDALLGEAR